MKKNVNELEIFAKTLFFEAGSTCDLQEVLHIAWVIRNRVEKKRWFKKNYIEVCLQKWQFSCWNHKTFNEIKKIKLNNFRYLMCMMIAEYVKDSPKKFNPIPGVCYYYNPQLCCPSWAKKLKRIYPQLNLKHLFLCEK